MSRREDEVRLGHMLDHAHEAVELCRARTRPDLDSDRLLNLALVRLIKIVGEAANRVSAQVQSQHPEIPWRQIIGMRNRIVHGYDEVDFDILWSVIQSDLPPLIQRLRATLGKPKERPNGRNEAGVCRGPLRSASRGVSARLDRARIGT